MTTQTSPTCLPIPASNVERAGRKYQNRRRANREKFAQRSSLLIVAVTVAVWARGRCKMLRARCKLRINPGRVQSGHASDAFYYFCRAGTVCCTRVRSNVRPSAAKACESSLPISVWAAALSALEPLGCVPALRRRRAAPMPGCLSCALSAALPRGPG